MNTHTVARIFAEPTGLFHVCHESLPYLDARGYGFRSRREAIEALRVEKTISPHAFTHYLTRSGRKVKI